MITTVPPVIEPFSFGLEPFQPASSNRTSQVARAGGSPNDLSPLSFSSRAAGSRARLICGLRRGDLPVRFQWLKDGRHLSEPQPQSSAPSLGLAAPTHGVLITNLDAFSSLLTIARLADGHTGNYTCLATKPAGRDRYTTSLTVRGTIGSTFIRL